MVSVPQVRALALALVLAVVALGLLAMSVARREHRATDGTALSERATPGSTASARQVYRADIAR